MSTAELKESIPSTAMCHYNCQESGACSVRIETPSGFV